MDHQYSADKQTDKANPHMQMNGRDHHAMMIADFKKRFYVLLFLTLPIMLLSNIKEKLFQ
ncbi:MAG: hypothetical protein ABIX36_04460 [Mucilaginibacter sp.]|uniref:hypothetical protein n=1 Tax=Mucilaginibacter sp. TaxID=1882438 RepID=UPI003265076F